MSTYFSADWKPVEYALPEIGTAVLIFEPSCDPSHPEYFTMATTHYAGPKPRGERYSYEWPDGQDEQPSGYAPTHWMSLPEPPKE